MSTSAEPSTPPANADAPINATLPPTPIEHEPSREREPIVRRTDCTQQSDRHQAGPSHIESPYPLFIEGTVVRGFGRGSKDLGCPTANLPDEAIAPFTSLLATGVHFGYARVAFTPDGSSAHDRVLPMVMSVGWNPYYKNEKRTLEVHVLDDFPSDFYGHHLRIAILGFIRPEYNYTSMDALIRDIETDKTVAKRSLDRPAYRTFANNSFFTRPYDA